MLCGILLNNCDMMEIKPYQIDQLIAEHSEDTTLDGLKTAILATRTHVCPKCAGSGLVVDPDNPPNLIEDEVCEGYGFTEVELVGTCIEYTYGPAPAP